MWVQGRLTKKQVTVRPGHLWREEWSSMSKNSQRKATNKWAEEKTKLDAAREQQGMYPSPDDEPGCEEIMNKARRKWEMRRASAMPCKVTTANRNGSSWRRLMRVVGLKCKRKQDHENMIIESQRIRTTKSKEKTHRDHIADRGHVSMSHHILVHNKPISIFEAVDVQGAGCNGQRLGKVENETIISMWYDDSRSDSFC